MNLLVCAYVPGEEGVKGEGKEGEEEGGVVRKCSYV